MLIIIILLVLLLVAKDWVRGEGLNILKATRMQVFDFMMEYFSLDDEKENEIESIISDIPE